MRSTRIGCCGRARRPWPGAGCGACAPVSRWDLVFSIAEGVAGRSREAQVPALCELFDQPYVFSDPLTMAATLDKSVAKRIVRDGGVADRSVSRGRGAAMTPSPAGSIIQPSSSRLPKAPAKAVNSARWSISQIELAAAAARPAQALWATGACRSLFAGTRIYGRDRRQRHRMPVSSASWRSCSTPRPSRASIRIITRKNASGLVTYRLADDAEAHRPANRRSTPITCSAAAMRPASTCASMRNGSPCSLRPIRLLVAPNALGSADAGSRQRHYLRLLMAMIVDAGAARYGLARSHTERWQAACVMARKVMASCRSCMPRPSTRPDEADTLESSRRSDGSADAAWLRKRDYRT